MKRLHLLLAITSLLLWTGPLMAQTANEDSTAVTKAAKPTKEEKKAAKDAKRLEKELAKSARKLEEFQQKQRNIVKMKELINDSLFVLEANYLFDRYGRSIPVTKTLNFIAIARDTLVLQVGSEFGMGPNGVGGITLQGRVTSYEATEGRGNISILMNVQSPLLGLATITVRITGTGSFRASVSGSWRQQIQMSGDFESWETTQIFQGRTTRLIYGPY